MLHDYSVRSIENEYIIKFSLRMVLAMLCALVAGDYMKNSEQGMCSRDNLRDTHAWSRIIFGDVRFSDSNALIFSR